MGKLSKADWKIVSQAMNHAIDEREALLDAYASCSDLDEDVIAIRKRCEKFITEANSFCEKHFGQKSGTTQEAERLSKLTTVCAFTLVTTSKRR